MTEGLQSYLLTILALQILTAFFGNKKDEWKMIKTKANRWCRAFKDEQEKKNVVDQMEKTIKKFNMAKN